MELTNFKGTTRNIENKFARYPEVKRYFKKIICLLKSKLAVLSIKKIRSFVYDTVQANPDIASVYVAGKSVESRELPVIVLKTATSQRAIWIGKDLTSRKKYIRGL